MKTKHISLVFSIVLMSILLVATVWAYLLQQSETYPNIRLASNSMHLKQHVMTVPEDKLHSIAENIFLYESIEQEKYFQTDLSVLGYAPIKQNFDGKQRKNKISNQIYNISMAIVFNENRYCVIDNKFYREGDYLSKDVLVKTVQKKRVLINEYGKEQWHKVKNGKLKNKGNNNEAFVLSAR